MESKIKLRINIFYRKKLSSSSKIYIKCRKMSNCLKVEKKNKNHLKKKLFIKLFLEKKFISKPRNNA